MASKKCTFLKINIYSFQNWSNLQICTILSVFEANKSQIDSKERSILLVQCLVNKFDLFRRFAAFTNYDELVLIIFYACCHYLLRVHNPNYFFPLGIDILLFQRILPPNFTIKSLISNTLYENWSIFVATK